MGKFKIAQNNFRRKKRKVRRRFSIFSSRKTRKIVSIWKSFNAMSFNYFSFENYSWKANETLNSRRWAISRGCCSASDVHYQATSMNQNLVSQLEWFSECAEKFRTPKRNGKIPRFEVKSIPFTHHYSVEILWSISRFDKQNKSRTRQQEKKETMTEKCC